MATPTTAPNNSGTSTSSAPIPHPLTIVVKLGSSSILSPETFLPNLTTLSSIAETCVQLRRMGHRVVLVSSGAIAMGMKRMDRRDKGKSVAEKQALAAIGQGRLIALWDNLFGQLDQPTAQILLTRNEVGDRSRYLNSRTTLLSLLSQSVIPIVNENDTVSVHEIKFGDNDTLSAITAGLVGADWLFLCTDVEGLWTSNPGGWIEREQERLSMNGNGGGGKGTINGEEDQPPRRVMRVRDLEEVRRMVSTDSAGSAIGTGGMETKLIAAELATASGVNTVITLGSKPERVVEIIKGYTETTWGKNVVEEAEEFWRKELNSDAGGYGDSDDENTANSAAGSRRGSNSAGGGLGSRRGSSNGGRNGVIVEEDEDVEGGGPKRGLTPTTFSGDGVILGPAINEPSPMTSPLVAPSLQPQNLDLEPHLPPHTLFHPLPLAHPSRLPPLSRRYLLLHALTPRGAVLIDEGAFRAVSLNGRFGGNGGRLLAAGIVGVEGEWSPGQAVRIVVVKGMRGKERRPSMRSFRRDESVDRSNLQQQQFQNFQQFQQHQQQGQQESIGVWEEVGRGRSAEFRPHARARQLSHDVWSAEGTPRITPSATPREGSPVRDPSGNEVSPSPGAMLELVEVARGLANYGSLSMERLRGRKSSEIERTLGYIDSEHVVESITMLERPTPYSSSDASTAHVIVQDHADAAPNASGSPTVNLRASVPLVPVPSRNMA